MKRALPPNLLETFHDYPFDGSAHDPAPVFRRLADTIKKSNFSTTEEVSNWLNQLANEFNMMNAPKKKTFPIRIRRLK